MKMRVMVLVAMVLAWSVPAYAMTAQQCYGVFTQYEQVLNSKGVTPAALEQASVQASQAAGAYAQESRQRTAIGAKDRLVSDFTAVALSLSFVTSEVIRKGDLEKARKETRKTMEELKRSMERR